MTGKSDLAASVAARLLNRSRATGVDHQILMTTYGLERFVLKGAMLLRLWSDEPYRATRDLDLLRRGEGSFEAIRAEDEFAGTRATLRARCGKARLTLQVDMGLGDAVWPAPQACTYPTLLDSPAPDLLAYPREAVVAEKFEAMVVLGDRNSRIKDFFDLHHLASRYEFDRATLSEAVRRTFERRRTPVPADEPIGLTVAYWENPSRPPQVRAFARRAGLDVPAKPAEGFTRLLHKFLSPVLDDLRSGARVEGTWGPGGPWV
jgi:hypothetical protein